MNYQSYYFVTPMLLYFIDFQYVTIAQLYKETETEKQDNFSIATGGNKEFVQARISLSPVPCYILSIPCYISILHHDYPKREGNTRGKVWSYCQNNWLERRNGLSNFYRKVCL